MNEFCRQYNLPFKDLSLLKLALTHRSYLSVTGQGPRESNERLEFLGDSVLGLVTSEFLYRRHPDEHEGQLTKTKSLLVSKAILSRRALRIGLGRFVLMSHSEVESGGRQRLSILADAFESVIGAVYLDQGFEPARAFIHRHLLVESDAITSDKRHTNYKSHLQEYVQNSFRTHPVYRIRSEYGPDHSKHFMVEVMVGRRTLGEGRGHNKKEAEQAAARDALEKVERLRRRVREDEDRAAEEPPAAATGGRQGRERSIREEPAASARGAQPASPDELEDDDDAREASDRGSGRRRRRGRRGGRGGGPGRHGDHREGAGHSAAPESAAQESARAARDADDMETAAESRYGRGGAFAESVAFEPETEHAEYESPELEPSRTSLPAVEAAPEAEHTSTSAPPPARAFGRGRRREPAPLAPVRPEDAGAEPGPAGEERRVDVFTSPPPGTEGAPPPVVDVADAETGVEVESDREREARIEEMERALESFGRRRTSEYGRRGRRR